MSVTSHVIVLALLWICYEILRPGLAKMLEEPIKVWTIYRIRRQQRLELEAHVRRIASLKARIAAVGTIEGSDPRGQLILGPGWSFDCSNGTPINRVDELGVYRFCGYTSAELREIHARRDEFANRPNN